MIRSNGKGADVGQGRKADAEIVQSDLDAEGVEPAQFVEPLASVVEQGRLRDLDLEAARRKTAAVERLDHLVGVAGSG